MSATPASPSRPMPAPGLLGSLRHHKAAAGLGLLAAVAAGWFAVERLRGPEVPALSARRADLVSTLVATGHVETPYRVEIASQVTGTVAEVLVEEGQAVAAGQPLVTLEQSELEAAVVQAEGAVAQAEARLRQVRELTLPAAEQSLRQARATLANAEAVRRRADELLRGGFGTRAAFDEAEKALAVARAQERMAQLQVFTASAGGTDHVMAETQVAQARANLATVRARLGYAAIRAPRAGTLIGRTVERGTVVQPGKALFVLAPAGPVQLVVQIDEKNLGAIALQQPALASADAFPDRRFAATLSFVNPSIDLQRASVEVKLTVPDPPDYLRQDMTVSVDLEVARSADTIVVPTRVVQDANGAAPWVLVAREGRTHRQPVRVGLKTPEQTEILEGIGAGDWLIASTAGLQAGRAVRVVQP